LRSFPIKYEIIKTELQGDQIKCCGSFKIKQNNNK